MAFLDRLDEITRPKIHEHLFDFGLGDGEETIYFRGLSFEQRQKLIVARGTGSDGKMDVRGAALMLNAEIVAATFCKKDGKAVATTEAVQKWEPSLVDRLSVAAIEALDIGKKDENPS